MTKMIKVGIHLADGSYLPVRMNEIDLEIWQNVENGNDKYTIGCISLITDNDIIIANEAIAAIVKLKKHDYTVDEPETERVDGYD